MTPLGEWLGIFYSGEMIVLQNIMNTFMKEKTANLQSLFKRLMAKKKCISKEWLFGEESATSHTHGNKPLKFWISRHPKRKSLGWNSLPSHYFPRLWPDNEHIKLHPGVQCSYSKTVRDGNWRVPWQYPSQQGAGRHGVTGPGPGVDQSGSNCLPFPPMESRLSTHPGECLLCV